MIKKYNNQLFSLNSASFLLVFCLKKTHFHTVFFPTHPKPTVILALHHGYNEQYQET